MAENTTSVE